MEYVNYQLHFDPAFESLAKRGGHNGESFEDCIKYMHSIVSYGYGSVMPFNVMFFDPNAHFTVKSGVGPVIVPALSLVYKNVEEAHVRDYLNNVHKQSAVLEEHIQRVRDPNGDGIFMSPLFFSIANHGWHIFELLSHPEIDPNPDYRKVKFGGCSLSKMAGANGEKRAISLVQLGIPEQSPLEMLALQHDEIIRDPHMLDEQRLDYERLKAHYERAIPAMIETGAIVTPYVWEMIEDHPELYTRVTELQSSAEQMGQDPEREFTLGDIKLLYAFGMLNDLLVQAHSDKRLGDKLGVLRNQLPAWLELKYGAAFDLLQSGFRESVGEGRTSWTEGRG